MTQHTPGPWDYHVADNAPTPHIAIEDEVGDRIADVYFIGWNNQEAARKGAANARLIAAAPDLLAALWDCEQLYAEYMALRPDPNTDAFSGVQVLMKRLRTAIAQAKGEE